MNMRSHAAVLGNNPSVERMSRHLHPRVSVPTLAAAVVVVAQMLSPRLHGRFDGCPRRRIECSIDIDGAVRRISESQVTFLDRLTLSVGHPLRIGTMPGVHRVVPEAANAAFPGGLQERGFIERFSALGVCDRLCMTRDDSGMGETDLPIPDRVHGLCQILQLLTDVKKITRGSRRHVALVPNPIRGRH